MYVEAYPDKGRRGNVEVKVQPLMCEDTPLHPRVFLDNRFIGNASKEKPILYLRRGTYTIRVELQGYEKWEEKVRVLGSPTMQIINVNLLKGANGTPASTETITRSSESEEISSILLPAQLFGSIAAFPENEKGDTISLAVHADWAPKNSKSKNYWMWCTKQSEKPKPVLLKKDTEHFVEAHVNYTRWTVQVYINDDLRKGGEGNVDLKINEDATTTKLVIRVHVEDDDPCDALIPPPDLKVTLTVAELLNLISTDSTPYDNPNDTDSPFDYLDPWPFGSDPEKEDQQDTWKATLNPPLKPSAVPYGFVIWSSDCAYSTFVNGADSLQQVHIISRPATYTITVK